MGIRFRRSIKIAPGVKLNVNKKSIGLTAGVKGAHISANTNGEITKSVGLPGTGISYTDRKKINSNKSDKAETNYDSFGNDSSNFSEPPKNKTPFYKKTWFIILTLLIFPPLGVFLMWKYTSLNKPIKSIISVVFLLVFIIALVPNEKAVDDNNSVVENNQIETQEDNIQSESETSNVEAENSSNTELLNDSNNNSSESNQENITEANQNTENTNIINNEATNSASETNQTQQVSRTVYITKTGSKYHYDSTCGNGTYYESTLDEAKAKGLTPCSKCAY